MFTCPGCSKANNIYATQCQHCGAALSPVDRGAPPIRHVREPCPKCSHMEFLVISGFAIPDTSHAWSLMVLPVVCAHLGGKLETAGSFHAYVCAQCGYTEWYATDLRRLTELAGKLNSVQLVNVSGPTPYR